MSENLPNEDIAPDQSANSSPSKSDKKCFICKKKFGLGKKYSCSQCQSFVCSRHSIKKHSKTNDLSFRLCDVCDMDEIRQEVKREILEELTKLKQNIDLAKESYKKVENSRAEKAKIVKELEEEILVTEKKQKIKEDELQAKINEEFIKVQKANQEIDNAKKEISELSELEKEINQKCLENTEKTEQEKGEILRLKEKRTEMLAQIEHLSGKLKGSLPKDQVFAVLCEMCRKKVLGDGKAQKEDNLDLRDSLDT